MMMRKTGSVLTFVLMVLPAMASALGLGNIELHSALNQPLRATIPLRSVEQGDLEGMVVSLGSADQFRRAGIDRPFFLSQLRFEVIESDTGAPVVEITTRNAVVEPFLNFLLEVNWPRGRVVREYTLLLDPPVYGAAISTTVEQAVSTAERRAEPAPSPAAAPPATGVTTPRAPAAPSAPTAPTQYASGGDSYGPVQRDETLWSIAQRSRPDGSVSVNKMMMALLRANPDAFIRGNINALREGAVLRIPDRQEIDALGQRDAMTAVQRHHAEWQEYRQGVASTPAPAPTGVPVAAAPTEAPDMPAPEPEAPMDDGRLEVLSPGAAAEGPGGAGADVQQINALRNELALALEEIDTRERENQDLLARVDEAESLLGDLQRLLELKDDNIAALQQRLSQVDEAAGAGEAAMPEQETAPTLEAERDLAAMGEMAAETDGMPGEGPPGTEAGEPMPEDGEGVAMTAPGEAAPETMEAEPMAAAPMEGEPGAMEAEPMTAAPMEGEPGAMDAEPMEPAPMEGEPGAMDAETMQPAPMDAEPAPMEAEPMEPAPMEAEPAPMEPEPMEPAPVEMEPQAMEPGPEAAQPEPAPTAPVMKPQVPLPPPAPPRSFLDEMRDVLPVDPLLLGGGVGLLVVLGIILAVMRRRRPTEEEEDEFTAGADLGIDEQAEQLVAEGGDQTLVPEDAPVAAPEEEVAESAPVEAEEAPPLEDDPLAEVNVYLAYERFEQAEQLVRDAIEKHPERHDYRLKLLEIAYAAKNVAAFQAGAQALRDAAGEEGPLLEKARGWWEELAPGQNMFGEPATAGEAMVDTHTDIPGEDEVVFDVTAGDESGAPPSDTIRVTPGDVGMGTSEVDFDLGFEEQSTDSGATGELDLDLGDEATVAAAPGEALDFELDGTGEGTEPGMEAGADSEAGEDSAQEIDFVLEGGEEEAGSSTGTDTEVDFDLGDLGAEEPVAEEFTEPGTLVEAPDLELEPEDAQTVAALRPSGVDEVDDGSGLDLEGGLDFDLGAESSAGESSTAAEEPLGLEPGEPEAESTAAAAAAETADNFDTITFDAGDAGEDTRLEGPDTLVEQDISALEPADLEVDGDFAGIFDNGTSTGELTEEQASAGEPTGELTDDILEEAGELPGEGTGLDLELDELEPGEGTGLDLELVSDDEPEGSGTGLDLELPEIESPEASDFGLEPMEPGAVLEPGPGVAEEPDTALEPTPEISGPAEFQIDEGTGTDATGTGADELAPLDFDLSMDDTDLDLPGGDTAAGEPETQGDVAGTDEAGAAPEAESTDKTVERAGAREGEDVWESTQIFLNEGEGEGTEGESAPELGRGLSGDIDEIQTKLDLAQAYVDMGDADGARSILGEVMAEGSDAQKQDAEAMLARLD